MLVPEHLDQSHRAIVLCPQDVTVWTHKAVSGGQGSPSAPPDVTGFSTPGSRSGLAPGPEDPEQDTQRQECVGGQSGPDQEFGHCQYLSRSHSLYRESHSRTQRASTASARWAALSLSGVPRQSSRAGVPRRGEASSAASLLLSAGPARPARSTLPARPLVARRAAVAALPGRDGPAPLPAPPPSPGRATLAAPVLRPRPRPLPSAGGRARSSRPALPLVGPPNGGVRLPVLSGCRTCPLSGLPFPHPPRFPLPAALVGTQRPRRPDRRSRPLLLDPVHTAARRAASPRVPAALPLPLVRPPIQLPEPIDLAQRLVLLGASRGDLSLDRVIFRLHREYALLFVVLRDELRSDRTRSPASPRRRTAAE